MSLGALPARVADVRKRVDFAEKVEQRSIVDNRSAWDEAIRSIADETECPLYHGLRLDEQLGLVPIGQDRVSRLWEFAHIQSGEIPERDEMTGELVLTDDMCIVLVLLPGGTFRMGSEEPTKERSLGTPNVDPHTESNESPVHEVTLGAFYLSKFEMTQGQWTRLATDNPSLYQKGLVGGVSLGPLNPVEQVDWFTCADVLRRGDLLLPTEAQWEYAARAGTTSVWWTGTKRESLLGNVNLADQAARRAGANWPEIDDYPELDDGHALHAPVGSFPANPWGLHEVHGNVWEWCREWYSSRSYSFPAGKRNGLRHVPSSSTSHRTARGGSFVDTVQIARSANRVSFAPTFKSYRLGLRPARAVSK